MAELLVMNVDNVGRTPEKTALLYKRGDVVVVMPDGHVWGAKESPPTFRIVHRLGPPEDYAHLLTPAYAPNGRDIVGRRKNYINEAGQIRSR